MTRAVVVPAAPSAVTMEFLPTGRR